MKNTERVTTTIKEKNRVLDAIMLKPCSFRSEIETSLKNILMYGYGGEENHESLQEIDYELTTETAVLFGWLAEITR